MRKIIRRTQSRLARLLAPNTRPTHGSIQKAAQVIQLPTHSALPGDLLYIVFELLEFDHNTLWRCMRVCKLWYDNARPHFYAVIQVREYRCQDFVRFFSAHPEVSALVKEVIFLDGSWGPRGIRRYGEFRATRGPFDIRLLLSTLPVLTNLRKVILSGYDHLASSPPAQDIEECRHTSVALHRLSFYYCSGVAFVLPKLLSLFSLDTLVIIKPLADATEETSLRIYPSTAPKSIVVRNLLLGGSGSMMPMDGYYEFFQSVLAPGLHAVGVGSWYKRELPSLSRFIASSPADTLLSISIDMSFGEYFTTEETPFHNLGDAIGHCGRLRCIRIGFIHNALRTSASHDVFSPIVANLPATLRVFAIRIQMSLATSWREQCANAVGLDAVDNLLAPAGGRARFPDLRRVKLEVISHVLPSIVTDVVKPLEEYDPPVLPVLQAAGLLQFEHRLVEREKRASDAFGLYLPPEMHS